MCNILRSIKKLTHEPRNRKFVILWVRHYFKTYIAYYLFYLELHLLCNINNNCQLNDLPNARKSADNTCNLFRPNFMSTQFINLIKNLVFLPKLRWDEQKFSDSFTVVALLTRLISVEIRCRDFQNNCDLRLIPALVERLSMIQYLSKRPIGVHICQ